MMVFPLDPASPLVIQFFSQCDGLHKPGIRLCTNFRWFFPFSTYQIIVSQPVNDTATTFPRVCSVIESIHGERGIFFQTPRGITSILRAVMTMLMKLPLRPLDILAL